MLKSDKKISIIVIDDDQTILRSIEKQLLRFDTLQIDFVNDPIEGIKRIHEKKYDLVLCDIKMKPITGLEVLKEIKKDYPELPVIILTGFVDDKIMESAKDLGSNDFLIKPVRKDDLLNSIEAVLNAR